MTVRTKWHRVAEAIKAGHSAVYTGNNRISGRLEEWGTSKEEMLHWWNGTANLPKFVVQHELITLASENHDFHLSLRDMQKAGVLRLPFPQIVVEYNVRKDDPATNLVVLIDLKDEGNREMLGRSNPHIIKKIDENGVPFMAYPFVMGHGMGNDIVGVPSSCCICGMNAEGADGDPMLLSVRYSNPMFDAVPESRMRAAMEATKAETQSWSALAFMAVTLLMITEGVEKEQCSVGNLNRKRVSSGKAIIPDYTYLHINKVFRSAQGSEGASYDERKSPRPHWRRGHLRSVRYGTGRNLLRTVFIRPRLVALKGDAKIDPPQYVVDN